MTTSTVEKLVADYLERLHRAAGALPHDQARELVDEIGGHIASARADGDASNEAAVRTMLDRLGTPEEIVAAARDDGAPTPAVPTRPAGTGLELAAVLMLTAGSFLFVVGWLVGVVLLWSSRRWSVAEKLLGTLVVPLGPGGVYLLGAGSTIPASSCTTSVAPVPVPAAPDFPAPAAPGVPPPDMGTPAPPPAGPPPAPAGPPPAPVDALAPPPETPLIVEQCSGFSLPPWLGLPLLVVMLAAPVVVAVWLYRRASSRAALEPPRPARPGAGPSWGGLELAAVLLLSLGSFVIPVVGPLVGAVLVWCSPRWSTTDKAVAMALPLVSLALITTYYVGAGSVMGLGLGMVELLLLSALFPLAAAGYLALRLSQRR